MAIPNGNQTIVVGGGVVGVTTLYELAADGVPAILLEAEPELAAGASHANGAALTPGLADPWNSPGVHRHLFESLFDPRSAMKLRLSAIPGLASWGIQFLRNSTSNRHTRAMKEGFRIASYSLQRTQKLAGELEIERVLIPRYPGVLSAGGLLAAPIEHEFSCAFHTILGAASLAFIREALKVLDKDVEALMGQERVEGLR